MAKERTDDMVWDVAKKSVEGRQNFSRSRVIDPMMVSSVRATADERKMRSRYNAEDDFLSEEATYDINDLYDENGALIMGEADEALGEVGAGRFRSERRRFNQVQPKRNKTNFLETEDDFDLTEEELEDEEERKNTRKRNARRTNERADKFRKKAEKKARTRTPVWVKILIGFLVLVIFTIAFGAYYFINIYSAASGALNGNPMDAFFNKKPLVKDEYGRTNILIFGTAEDDEGHDGGMLTDSILVVSVDQEKKTASTFSVPRDLWVNYTVAGEKTLACSAGYKGKINATYYCKQEASDGDREVAAKYFAKKVTELTDVQIQYYVAVDFKVLRDIVNVLGGIDVDVHATDERGIYDICMHNIKLKKGINQNLNGDMVLDLARARNAKGGYGLANSNFDREINQQRIINGIKNKALNVGILADPNKIKGMLESFGNNVKTNLNWAEMGTAMDVVTGMKGDVKSIDTRNLYGTGRIGMQSVVIPAGANTESEYSLYNYNKIHLYLRKELNKNATDENDEDGQNETNGGNVKKDGVKTNEIKKNGAQKN